MSTDARYARLFEPVQIGPKTAKNRFYQVPHCNGMGRNFPSSMARMRGIKAEGGWAVVCTEQCDYHWTSDSVREIRLWDDQDIPMLARMVGEVHEHGALASLQLVHMGYYGRNLYSRESSMSPSGRPPGTDFPGYARTMDKQDIANLRRWHRNAALRGKKAGYDIIMVYAGHDISLPFHFLSRRHNQRNDEYGGSMENRARLLRELIEETKEAVGDTCGVSVRLAVDELMGESGLTCDREGRDIIEMLGELPDLWDVNCSDWSNDSVTARFAEEGFQEDYTGFVKQLTSKPVVGVGRYTSPDRMAALIKRGVLDMIGAARPSIADPFLPNKIQEGRIEEICECIGCNICVGYSNNSVPIRCTQNPTMGEEWRRGWHPEHIPPRGTDDKILIVGAGPAGLEAARVLGKRGYDVVLAEAEREPGGRVTREAKLPGLASWSRVRDFRTYQISQMANVNLYLESRLGIDEVFASECSMVAIAIGAEWRRDGVGRAARDPVPGLAAMAVYTPDDVMAGAEIEGPVVVYDDDHYYMGGIIAEQLRAKGLEVTLVTPGAVVSSWTDYTLEQGRIQAGLHEIGVEIIPLHSLHQAQAGGVTLSYAYTGAVQEVAAASLVLVTALQPNEALYEMLLNRQREWADHGIQRITAIGDCFGSGTIAHAVWSGHKFARTLGAPEYERDEVPFRRENMEIAGT
ncbi:MAG: NAD(P)-binding protein [Alphaproteobacteria bacterium]|nr:NAD(P)-binding protein [Alphaproteobacteria bacterium]